MAASGGWLALNSSVLNGFGYALLAMAGAAMLLLAWRIGARDRFTPGRCFSHGVWAQAPPFLQAGLPFSATTGAGQDGWSGQRLPPPPR